MLALPLILMLTLAGAVVAWRDYQVRRQSVVNESMQLARGAATIAERYLQDRIHLLEAVAASPVVIDAQLAQAQVYVQRVEQSQPDVQGIGWLDSAGQLRMSSGLPLGSPPIDLSDRDYFRAVVETRQPAVGAGNIGRPNGLIGFGIAAPVIDPAGRLVGVVAGRIDLVRMIEALGVTLSDANLIIVDRANQVIVGPGAETLAPAAAEPLVQRARVDGAGVMTEVPVFLGQRNRLVSYATVASGNWLLFLDEPAEAAFAPAWRNFLVTTSGMIFLGLVGAGGIFWLAGRLDRLAQVEREVAAENERLYQQAQAALRERGTVFSSISHDLKNPLAGIRASAQLLERIARRDQMDRERATAMARNIMTSADTMTAMLEELVDAARLHEGRTLELQRAPVDLVALAGRLAETQQHRSASHTVTLETDLEALVGNWDGVRLERMLSNLIDNAIKYSPAGGPVRIRLHQDADAVAQVIDQGVGIPPDELPHIFRQFYRGRNVAQIRGTGIGLAAVRQIVEEHGGVVTVESPPGRGTTVTVRLPLASPDGSPEEPARAGTPTTAA